MIEEQLKPYICPRFLSDEHYRQGHVHILAPKPGTVVLGLHTPEMKMLAKQFVESGEWENLADLFAAQVPIKAGVPQPLCHEERMIWGLMIDYAKVDLSRRCALIEQFLPAIDNWAICDTFCCNSKWAKKADKESLWRYLEKLYAVSPKSKDYEFTLRTALILSMCHFIDEESLDRTFSKLAGLRLPEDSPYYIRMGMAWLLATALAKHEERTRAFVGQAERDQTIPHDIVKLYVRKARESRFTRNVCALPNTH